jgi:hypothetical protein
MQFMPVPFGREQYLNGKPKSIEVQGPRGKKWPLKTLWRKAAKRNLYVNRGWPMFLKDNKSKETYVCGFELINNKDAVLKLSIFRAVKDPGPQIKLTE